MPSHVCIVCHNSHIQQTYPKETQEHSCMVLVTAKSKTLITKLNMFSNWCLSQIYSYNWVLNALRTLLSIWLSSLRDISRQPEIQTPTTNCSQVQNLTLLNSRISIPLLLSNRCGHCSRWQRKKKSKTLNMCNTGEPRTLNVILPVLECIEPHKNVLILKML